MNYSLLKIRDLTFGFSKGRQPISDSMNFDLEAGQRVSILGANGVCKSTLIMCLGMLEPASGSIELRTEGSSAFPFPCTGLNWCLGTSRIADGTSAVLTPSRSQVSAGTVNKILGVGVTGMLLSGAGLVLVQRTLKR